MYCEYNWILFFLCFRECFLQHIYFKIIYDFLFMSKVSLLSVLFKLWSPLPPSCTPLLVVRFVTLFLSKTYSHFQRRCNKYTHLLSLPLPFINHVSKQRLVKNRLFILQMVIMNFSAHPNLAHVPHFPIEPRCQNLYLLPFYFLFYAIHACLLMLIRTFVNIPTFTNLTFFQN